MKFLICYILLLCVCTCSNQRNHTKNLVFELDAIVLKNDEFQLFYSNDFINDFKEAASIKTKIIGTANIQKIKFVLPLNANLNRIRIDLGNNTAQSEIIISKISMILGSRKIIYQDNVKNEQFLANDCVNLSKNIYHLTTDKGVYDPYIISKNIHNQISLLIDKSSDEK